MDRWGNYDIYVMDADGSDLMRLAEGLDHADFDDYWFLVPPQRSLWSPDGDQLAVMSGHDDEDFDIYVVNADGSGLTRLTDNPAYDWLPAWSPDSQRIALYSRRDGDFHDVYVMNADGSGQTHLAKGITNDNLFFLSPPAWSPDGRQIAFVSDRDGKFDIYVMNADRSNQTRLTHNPAIDEYLTWSPDGRQIAFTSRPDEDTFAIYVINADDSGLTRLTHDTDTSLFPVWSPLSPTATPASAMGSVQGVLIERESNEPIASAYVLLCAVIDPAASEPECLSRASLTAVTGTDGGFLTASVPQGTYVVVYGLSDEAQGSPQTWDGRSVHYPPLVMISGKGTDKNIDPFGGNQGAHFPKGSEIGVAGGDICLKSGAMMSIEFGLSIECREYEPLVVSVTAGQTAQVTVDVTR